MNKQTPKHETRVIQARELRVATNDNGQRVLSGYASVFNTVSVDMGGWAELVAPTAFTRTLQENPDVLCLYAHDTAAVLGRTTSNTVTLSVDATGLKFDCVLPDTTTANDLIVLVERGDITGMSFGFVCISDVWSEDSDGRYIRTLLDVDLFEITVTSSPAYPSTSISLRSAPKEIRSKIREKRNADCKCPCDACVDSDGEGCENCTNPDCDDLNCASCRSERDIDVSADDTCEWKATMEIRLKLLALKNK
jgi:HK97 family phage prohead protease